jgi:hypothetical protein
MAIIALPATTRFARKIEWTLDRPAQVNRSGWTGRRQVVANPWHGMWRAQVELVPIIGEANVRPTRAFLAKLKGQINTFLLPAVEGDQHSYVSPFTGTVVSGAAGASTMVVGSMPAFVTYLTAGCLMQIPLPSGKNQMVMLTQDLVSDSFGVGTATFEPPLRETAAVSTAIEAKRPCCEVALAGSSISWGVEPGKIYGVGTLQLEEAF